MNRASSLWSDRLLDVLIGDAAEVMATMPAESVHCVVTSPPYWGLRDYGTASWDGGDPDHLHVGSVQRQAGGRIESPKQMSNVGSLDVRSGDCACGARRSDDQLGLEDSPDEFVDRLVAIFREVRRVLRPDGTVWLNLGDTYAGAASPSSQTGLSSAADAYAPGRSPRAPNRDERGEVERPIRSSAVPSGLKAKDLVGIPWRVALALQRDGWYLRSDIVWSKPNPMPSSVGDRPTVAHEYVFLLAKSSRYYYDADAVREATGREADWAAYAEGDAHRAFPATAEDIAERGVMAGWGRKKSQLTHPLGRNMRTVWTIAARGYAGAHYATFPEALVEPCVLAGSSDFGVCRTCGAPWHRVVEVGYVPVGGGQSFATNWQGGKRGAEGRGEKTLTPEAELAGQNPGPQGMPYGRADKLVETIGWKPGCEHGDLVIPATVLDPFAGSGTTGRVAQRLGRRAVLIDLKGEYLSEQAMPRNRQMGLGLVGSASDA